MKHKALILLFLALIFSCDSLFHEDSNDYIALDNEQEVLDILNGIYAQLVRAYDDGYFQTVCRADDINLYPRYNFSSSDFPRGGCGSGGSHDYSPNYGNIYFPLVRIIINANSLLSQLSETKDANILGEVYFLRAYSYFTLVRFYGNPHIVTDIDVDYTLGRPSYEEAYHFIENDIEKALPLLPDTKYNARITGETPNKGTAKALLAELYLSWAGYPVKDESKYSKAMAVSGDLIKNHENYGIGLEPHYSGLWDSTNKYSSESIFALFFDLGSNETQNRIGGYHGGYSNEGVKTSGRYMPEFKYFDDFPNDERKRSSFYRPKFFDPKLDPCEYLHEMFTLKWLDSTKMLGSPSFLDSDLGTARTLHLIRFAHTLFTFSEARAMCGILDDSTYEAVNMIRRRANGADPYTPSEYDLLKGLSQEQFIDSVVSERAWEFNFEPNGRWFDIVRLDLREKLSEYRYDHDIPYKVPDDYLQENWYFYKIPVN